MKKKINSTFYILFFLALLIIEEYCILEYRKDSITIIGISIAFLIAAYLLIDSIKQEISEYQKRNNVFLHEIKESKQEFESKCNEIINLEKAIYVIIKKKIKNESEDNNRN